MPPLIFRLTFKKLVECVVRVADHQDRLFCQTVEKNRLNDEQTDERFSRSRRTLDQAQFIGQRLLHSFILCFIQNRRSS